MLNHKTKLVARIDPLKCLINKANLTSRLAKWVMMLRKFDIEYINRKVIKGKVIVDQILDASMIDDSSLVSEFLDESIFTGNNIQIMTTIF